MTSPTRLPVTLLTGFLGSGKTTLLNRLLQRQPLTAVVMNEFGEIGLDHQLLESSQGPLALLSGGCVCCQVQGSLAPTLRNLWLGRADGTLPAYGRVVIETTGLADPAPVLDVLTGDHWLAARHHLDGVLTTVDAVLGEKQLDDHFEALRQVAMADRLLLTKTDLVDDAGRRRLEARLAAVNPAAPRLLARHGEVAVADILDLGAYRHENGPADPERWLAHARYRPARRDALGGRGLTAAARHDGRIHAFSLTYETPLEWHAVSAALEMLTSFRAENLLRLKAILNIRGEEQPWVVHGVQHVLHPPGRLAAWPDADRRSRFVFIVSDLEEGFVARLLDDFIGAAEQGVLPAAGVA